jgi:hypothetical protein
MSMLAAALFVVVPADVGPAAHERTLDPRPAPVADALPKSIFQMPAPFADATHLQSTLVCPANIGKFERSAVVPFDGFGFDVGCSFKTPGVVITLYLTRRASQTLSDDLAVAEAALKQRLPDANQIDGAIPNPAGGPAFSGSLYTLDDGARTGVWVADMSGWTFKFRATYSPDAEAAAVEGMSALTQKAQATAGTHLGLCAAAPKVERNGTEITDKDMLMQLSLIGGLAGQAEADDGFQPKVRWCAEEAVVDQQAPLLFWRNIETDGTDGPADRLSLMTMGEPLIWNVTANAAANLIIDDKAKPEPLIHEVSFKEGTKTYLFAYYRGRPALETLAPLVKNIFAGKRNPVGAYDSKTNTVTLPAVSAKKDAPKPWEMKP